VKGDRDSISFRNAITPVRPVGTQEMARRRVRKLLFYSRPEAHNSRNLFEIGVLGLCRAIEGGCFAGEWEFHGIGALGSNQRMKLARGKHIELLPRMSLEEYQKLLGSYDLGLSLMYSPHPSLVPIEMAAAGMLTVTNCLFNKTESELQAISTNFVVTEATVEGVEQGLKQAVGRIGRYSERVAGARVNWSRSWDEAFDDDIRHQIIQFLEAASR
jgi:hypothetical protein